MKTHKVSGAFPSISKMKEENEINKNRSELSLSLSLSAVHSERAF